MSSSTRHPTAANSAERPRDAAHVVNTPRGARSSSAAHKDVYKHRDTRDGDDLWARKAEKIKDDSG
jgi:hypothetical protein